MSRGVDKIIMEGDGKQDIAKSHHTQTDDQTREDRLMKRNKDHVMKKSTPYIRGYIVEIILFTMTIYQCAMKHK